MEKKEKEAQEIKIGDGVYHVIGKKEVPKIVCAVSPAYVQFTTQKGEVITSREQLKTPEFLATCYWVNRNEIRTIKDTINIFEK